MSELNFPKNPAVGQEYTFNSLLYMFDGVKWVTKGTGYNPVQDLYKMYASDAGASLVGVHGYDNVQAAVEHLNSVDGNLQAQINTKINADFVSRFDREALRRSYADAGYNLVIGSFESGGTLVNANDVLLQESTGKAFSGPSGTVTAGTNPASGGFVDRSDEGKGGMTYSKLRTFTGHATSVYVVGKANIFDGGFGWFDVAPTDTASSDNGGTIIIDASGRRWKRRFSGEINLLWFAAGDGVTNDYQALVNAHNSLPATGGVIYAPGGHEYLINGNFVSTKPYFTLRGDGGALIAGDKGCTTFIKPATVNGNLIEIRGVQSTAEGFAIKGVSGNTGDGIQILAGRCTLRRISANGCGRDGIRIGSDDAGYNCNVWAAYDIKAKGNGRYGLNLDDNAVASPGQANANGGTLHGADLQNNVSHGLNIGNSQLNTLIGVVLQTNSGRGAYFSPLARYNTYIGGDSESNGGDEIHLAAGSTGNTILGGVVTGSVTDLGTGNSILGIGGSANFGGLKLRNRNSSVPTVLDWYEEVDWSSSAALSFGAPGDLAVRYSTKFCTAQRVGNEIHAKFVIATSSFTHSTASGTLRISGLPWPPSNNPNAFFAGALQYQGITDAARTCITARVNPNAREIQFVASGSGENILIMTASHVPSGGIVFLCGEVRYIANPLT